MASHVTCHICDSSPSPLTGTAEHGAPPASHPPTTLQQSPKQPTTMIQVRTAPLPCCNANNALCTVNWLLPRPQLEAAYSGCNQHISPALPSSIPAERPQQHYLTDEQITFSIASALSAVTGLSLTVQHLHLPRNRSGHQKRSAGGMLRYL